MACLPATLLSLCCPSAAALRALSSARLVAAAMVSEGDRGHKLCLVVDDATVKAHVKHADQAQQCCAGYLTRTCGCGHIQFRVSSRHGSTRGAKASRPQLAAGEAAGHASSPISL